MATDSADIWAEPQFFQLDEERRPQFVAGVPPDSFNDDGQLWGNALYDWDALKADGYGWWIRRTEGALKLYDVIRIDHFRGFESYWSVPAGAKTARNGEWRKGPGMDLVGVLKGWFPQARFIAEDLGCTVDVVLRSALTAEDFARAETEARVVYENPDVTIASTPDMHAQAVPPAAPKPPVR